jgi:hypothetical protein
MTYTEEAIESVSANISMTVDRWNKAVVSTRYPQYIYNQTAYVNGGNLDAYRRTWAGYDLGSIDSYGSRYTQYRDIRSTYMTKTYTSATSPANNVWTDVIGYNSISNTYNSTNQEGRLSPDVVNGYLKPNVNSVYLFYAEIVISSVPASMTSAFCQIRSSSGVRAEVNQNVALTAADSMKLRNQLIVAYRNGTSTPYNVRVKLLYSGTAPDFKIIFGYTELIGKKSGCGGTSII